MSRSGGLRWFSAWLAVAQLPLALSVPSARATEADMAVLPVVEPFRCLLCHMQANPTRTNHVLNLFGEDFLENGRRWNATLAALDSDGDGCSNGFELGDMDGNGVADGNVSVLNSNPGVPGDCGELIIDARTWGALKALFDR